MSYDNSNERKFGLWPQTSKAGNEYWRFFDKETGESFALFENNSTNPRAPKFNLVHTPPKDAQESDGEQRVKAAEDLPF
jgi:hypothetical protein